MKNSSNKDVNVSIALYDNNKISAKNRKSNRQALLQSVLEASVGCFGEVSNEFHEQQVPVVGVVHELLCPLRGVGSQGDLGRESNAKDKT